MVLPVCEQARPGSWGKEARLLTSAWMTFGETGPLVTGRGCLWPMLESTAHAH